MGSFENLIGGKKEQIMIKILLKWISSPFDDIKPKAWLHLKLGFRHH